MKNKLSNASIWRKNCKKRIVKAFNDKCCICGYNKCLSALALHHLNPKEKDKTISYLISKHTAWENIVLELRKCVLLCHNCHSEVHDNISIIPENSARFNEQYVNYIEINKQANKTYCLLCGQEKLNSNRYCSSECSNKASQKINWDNIDLIKELKTKSRVQLGKEIGVSDNAIKKRLIKLGLL